MATFPVSDWYDRLVRIAGQEIKRLVHGRQLLIVDRDNAVGLAVAAAWQAVSHSKEEIANVFGFARITMRNALFNEYAQRTGTRKRGRGYKHVPAIIVNENGDEAPNPELLTNTWLEVDDRITLTQLRARWHEHGLNPAPFTRKVSRQREEQVRREFVRNAKQLQYRKFDK